MLVLPLVLPGDQSNLVEAGIDAILLTAIVGPVLWWTLVRPIREVLRIRTRFLAELFTTIEAERRRIAHDLHDGVGQSISLMVSGLRSTQDEKTLADIIRRCQHLQGVAEATLREVKGLALGLRPSLLDDLGLLPALEKMTADIREQYPLVVTLDQYGMTSDRLPEKVETAVFRIVQEALTNILRHSKATEATILLDIREEGVVVSIRDNGCGFDLSRLGTARPGHLGLTGMRERALLVGGNLVIESCPGKGTRLNLEIPRDGASE